jgi:hypothetical protein
MSSKRIFLTLSIKCDQIGARKRITIYHPKGKHRCAECVVDDSRQKQLLRVVLAEDVFNEFYEAARKVKVPLVTTDTEYGLDSAVYHLRINGLIQRASFSWEEPGPAALVDLNQFVRYIENSVTALARRESRGIA